MDPKKPWLSKTLVVNFILAAVALVPGTDVWIAAHPQALVVLPAVVNIVLRFVTKQPLSLG